MEPFFVFDRVSFRYEAGDGSTIPALKEVSLSIAEGEMVAIVGANGSGKSTFARLASGLLLPASGTLRVDGFDTERPENRARVHARVGMVFQFPEDQIVSTTVEEDVAFGPENLGLPPDEIRKRVEGALRETGMWDQRSRPPHLLSAGQIQRVALAGVLAMRPRCVVFDEASTMLDPKGRETMIEAMLRLNREGVTVLFVTHFMEEAVLARRVIAFERGRVALDGPPAQVFSDPARLATLRLDLPPAMRLASAFYDALPRLGLPDLPRPLLTVPELIDAIPEYNGAEIPEEQGDLPESPAAPPVIDVRDLSYSYMRGTPLAHRALQGANLRVASGEVHGLLGHTGSGKSTLLQHLNGLMRPQEGSVQVAAFDLNDPRVARRDVVRHVGLVFQNPETQFFEHYVGDEIAYGPIQIFGDDEAGMREVSARVRWAMDHVGLDFATFKDRPLFALSGGERRKVALASTLALQPRILLLDEPTAGLDPHSRRDLLEKLTAMRDSGMTLALSSHQMGDMARLANSLTVFSQGRDVMTGSTSEIFAQLDKLHAYSMDAPVGAKVAAAMRAKGWPVPMRIIALDDLAGWIHRLGEGAANERV